MIKDVLFLALRVLVGVVAVIGAGMLVWRGSTYSDAVQGTTMLIPLMCTLTAMVLSITALAVVLHRSEPEQAA